MMIKLNGQTLWLSPERCVYWEEQKSLILADLHFGKTGHFRKSGIAVPQHVFKEDLQRLIQQVFFFRAEQLIIAGDFTHSHDNAELDLFRRWRKDIETVSILLIRGNHDILPDGWYQTAGIEIREKEWVSGPFRFLHDNEGDQVQEADCYTFSGHLHPGVRLAGAGKQSLRFPCFHFGTTHALLPAFSRFTGYKLVEKSRQDKLYAIVEKSIIPF